MNPLSSPHDGGSHPTRPGWAKAGLAILGILALVLIARSGELSGWLPFLLILACPLMHRFRHRGHSVGGQAGAAADPSATEPRD